MCRHGLWQLSDVKVKVSQNKNTPVKYRYLRTVLKYSNEVKILTVHHGKN